MKELTEEDDEPLFALLGPGLLLALGGGVGGGAGGGVNVGAGGGRFADAEDEDEEELARALATGAAGGRAATTGFEGAEAAGDAWIKERDVEEAIAG